MVWYAASHCKTVALSAAGKQSRSKFWMAVISAILLLPFTAAIVLLTLAQSCWFLVVAATVEGAWGAVAWGFESVVASVLTSVLTLTSAVLLGSVSGNVESVDSGVATGSVGWVGAGSIAGWLLSAVSGSAGSGWQALKPKSRPVAIMSGTVGLRIAQSSDYFWLNIDDVAAQLH